MTEYNISSSDITVMIDLLQKCKNMSSDDIRTEINDVIGSRRIPLSAFKGLYDILYYAPYQYASQHLESALIDVNYDQLPTKSNEYLSKYQYNKYKSVLREREGLTSVDPVILIYNMYIKYNEVYAELKELSYPSLHKFNLLGIILKRNSPLPPVNEDSLRIIKTFSKKNMNVNELISDGKAIILDSKEYDETVEPEASKMYYHCLINSMMVHIRKLEECVLGCPIHPTGKVFV